MRKLLLCCLALPALLARAQSPVMDDSLGLKDYYATYFTMGVAVKPRSVEPGDEACLIVKNFGSVTPENVMKPQPIHPAENEFNWQPADQIVAFAQANGMKVRGHTLCWHNQTPSWFFEDASGGMAGKTLVLQRLRDHIFAVVGRYKGKVYAWDVVNEAVGESTAQLYRDTPWLKAAGEEYIAKAFEYAHEADPDALLFYNDYNTEKAEKRRNIYTLVKGLLDKGVPIHGVGLQGHWSIYDDVTAQSLEESIQTFAGLGLTVQITELDVSVLNKELNPANTKAAFNPLQEKAQIEKYKMIFEVVRRNKDSISGITFWNVSDRTSWLDNFPLKGRKDYPLLFDQQQHPKKAYWEIIHFEK